MPRQLVIFVTVSTVLLAAIFILDTWGGGSGWHTVLGSALTAYAVQVRRLWNTQGTE